MSTIADPTGEYFKLVENKDGLNINDFLYSLKECHHGIVLASLIKEGMITPINKTGNTFKDIEFSLNNDIDKDVIEYRDSLLGLKAVNENTFKSVIIKYEGMTIC